MFSNGDSAATVDTSKNILNEIQNISDNILRNIRPADNRTVQEIIDDQFILIDDRTQQELEDISFESENKTEEIIDTTTAWNPKKTEISKPGPIIKLSTDYKKK